MYDALDGDRSDLDGYAAMHRSLGRCSVLDVGCGTGTSALRPSGGLDVMRVDPTDLCAP